MTITPFEHAAKELAGYVNGNCEPCDIHNSIATLPAIALDKAIMKGDFSGFVVTGRVPAPILLKAVIACHIEYLQAMSCEGFFYQDEIAEYQQILALLEQYISKVVSAFNHIQTVIAEPIEGKKREYALEFADSLSLLTDTEEPIESILNRAALAARESYLLKIDQCRELYLKRLDNIRNVIAMDYTTRPDMEDSADPFEFYELADMAKLTGGKVDYNTATAAEVIECWNTTDIRTAPSPVSNSGYILPVLYGFTADSMNKNLSAINNLKGAGLL